MSVGIDHDTAEFAVDAIRSWWQRMGQARFPHARSLVITADGGGSNGSRVRLWKLERQKLADELGLAITVCHLPPGTSKWNKIEDLLRVAATPARPVGEHHPGRVGSVPWSIVAGQGPEVPRLGPPAARVEHRRGRLSRRSAVAVGPGE